MAILFVLGNGFDLYHCLPTRYVNYKSFLEKNHPGVADDFESLPYLYPAQGCDLWSDVESSLTLDYEECLENALSSYPLNLGDDHPMWDDAAIWIDTETGFIDDFMGKLFHEWLCTIDVSMAKNFVIFPSGSLFVTFNYTRTLEKRYGVDNADILHIHGCLQDVNADVFSLHSTGTTFQERAIEERDGFGVQPVLDMKGQGATGSSIQFGSPFNSGETVRRELEQRYETDELYGGHIDLCVDFLEHFCEVAGKNLNANYAPLSDFVDSRLIQAVCVFGHGFDGVDEPYYSNVLVPKFKKIPWTFVVYDEVSGNNVSHFCENTGLRTMQSSPTEGKGLWI